MKWCSHCMQSVNIDTVVGTECTFRSCADCGKILGSVCTIGQKRKLERGRRTIVRTTESSLTEGDEADNVCLIGSVKKTRHKGCRRTIRRKIESSSSEGDAAD